MIISTEAINKILCRCDYESAKRFEINLHMEYCVNNTKHVGFYYITYVFKIGITNIQLIDVEE